MVSTNRYPLLYSLNTQIYRIIESIVRIRFSRIAGVVTIYLNHGRATGELFPGLSDFDLLIVFEPNSEHIVIQSIRKEWNRLRTIFPIRDLSLMSSEEFRAWQKSGGGVDPVDELTHWILLSGAELRANERLDLDSPIAERDRQRFSFSHFHTLLRTAIKDEVNTPLLLTTTRRQIYKSFCSIIGALSKDLLQIPKQSERLKAWLNLRDQNTISNRLSALHDSRFFRGEVSQLSFLVAATALVELDRVSKVTAHFVEPRYESPSERKKIFNESEIIARAKRFTSELERDPKGRYKAAILCSNGSPRGYALYILLNDEMGRDQISDALRNVHELFRLFDDPWFNEHYPAGIPIVCTEAIWRRELELWPFYREYYQQHPTVLFGAVSRSPYLDSETAANTLALITSGDRAALRRYYNQARLERSKAALLELITLYIPRNEVENLLQISPSTNEEAVALLNKTASPLRRASNEGFSRFAELDIDALLTQFDDETFNRFCEEIDAWLISKNGVTP